MANRKRTRKTKRRKCRSKNRLKELLIYWETLWKSLRV